MSDKRVFGFVGLGTMGTPLAGRLLADGFTLCVYDRNQDVVAALVEKGATAATSLLDIAGKADVIFLSLPTPDVVKLVTVGEGGLVEGSRVKTVVDLSTTGPRIVEEAAAGLGAAGITMIDCPVSGGGAGAINGTLALMAAGPREVIEGLEPALSNFGRLFIVGEKPGQGQTLKVINNMLSVAALAATCEGLVLGTKAGLDADVMIDVINAGSGRNSATVDKVPRAVLPRTFDFGMTIGLSSKDIRLCLEESDRLGVPMMVGSTVRQLLNITRDQLGADVDMTSIIRVIEQWAHVEVKGAAAKD